MANNLERAARDALTYLEDVIPRSLLTKDLRAALDAPPKRPTREQYAAAIWEKNSNHPRVKDMTWLELLDAVESNPSAWGRHHERALRQADAVMALEGKRSDLLTALLVARSALKEATANGVQVPMDDLAMAISRIALSSATPDDRDMINQAASE